LRNLDTKRLLGRYDGTEKGPLFICFGAMHGNEPAGVKAIDLVFKMLEVEPIRNPGFIFKGRMIGMIGNRRAFESGVRFHDRDLNRSFEANNLEQIRLSPEDNLQSEDLELLELTDLINQEIKDYQPEKIVVLDLHTTSSHGGIFTICRNLDRDIKISTAMHAPIVLGIIEGLEGTTLHYFTTENLGIDTIPITFESGQHQEGMAVNRAVAGIINCMKEIGCVKPEDVENHHEKILIDYSKTLPQVTTLVRHHSISEGDKFEMGLGYSNFQAIESGEVVAKDKAGPIIVTEEGTRILMPLYQKQGDDGFFLVKEIKMDI